jgi:hypothetical protein
MKISNDTTGNRTRDLNQLPHLVPRNPSVDPSILNAQSNSRGFPDFNQQAVFPCNFPRRFSSQISFVITYSPGGTQLANL